MPHSMQAKKRVRQNEQLRLVNKARRSSLRTQIKKFEQAIAAGDAAAAETEFKAATTKIDKAIKTRLIHKNMGARKKSQLGRKLNELKTKA